jgi:acetyl-CoA acetyltransferase
MSTPEVVLCNPVRTAIGAYNGSLKAIPATDLGATVVRETLRRSTRLIHSMRRHGLKRGIVTLCIGGGQGIALAVETLN